MANQRTLIFISKIPIQLFKIFDKQKETTGMLIFLSGVHNCYITANLIESASNWAL